MRFIPIRTDEEFKVVAGTERSQAAIMVLNAGQTTGGTDNRHEYSDQWLYVISGYGRAVVEGVEFELKKGSFLLIEKGEAHEITAGPERIVTINFYAPPEYPVD